MKQAKPTYQEVMENCQIFVANEGRQQYYTWASKVTNEAWSQDKTEDIDIGGVVSGIMILEYSWNEMFYQDGLFDFSQLAECVQKHVVPLSQFRKRDLSSFELSDQEVIVHLFADFLDALGNQNSHKRSPVSVGKCLHLLSPRFFPLWDRSIAKGTGYYWGTPVNTRAAVKSYIDFMRFTLELVDHVLHDFVEKRGVPLQSAGDAILKEYEAMVERRAVEATILKLMDEYLYVEHTHPEWKRR